MGVLVIAKHDNGSLTGATHHTVIAAAQCDGDVHVLIACSNDGGGAGQRRFERTAADAPRRWTDRKRGRADPNCC